MTTADRVAVLKQAAEIEAAGGQWESQHVAALLGLARKTIYDTAWLNRIKKPAGNGTWRWIPAEVRRQQEIEAGRRQKTLRRKVG